MRSPFINQDLTNERDHTWGFLLFTKTWPMKDGIIHGVSFHSLRPDQRKRESHMGSSFVNQDLTNERENHTWSLLSFTKTWPMKEGITHGVSFHSLRPDQRKRGSHMGSPFINQDLNNGRGDHTWGLLSFTKTWLMKEWITHGVSFR